jgi:thiol-disulfide isomerase/thioredoxin
MTSPLHPILRAVGATALGLLALGASVPTLAQTPPAREADAALRAIDEDYNQKLHELERDRLNRLQRLAAERQPKEAAAVYEQLFRLAIAGNLFVEAEPAADAVIKAGSPSPTTRTLAHLVKLVAECDRGAFDQSLTDLQTILAKVDKDAAEGKPHVALTSDEVLGICDAYYQRLVQAGRFDVALKACQLAAEHAEQPAVKSFLNNRLNRLKLIGEPAAAIHGVDLDGKPFSLVDVKGKVVFVVFWATWCLPSAAETEWLHQAYEKYHEKGLEIVGVNLDLMSEESPKLETLVPNIRRFVFDYNVRWPILVNRPADGDVAKAYGVTEIPANVLIDRDGKVAAIDLTRKNFESTLSKFVGR